MATDTCSVCYRQMADWGLYNTTSTSYTTRHGTTTGHICGACIEHEVDLGNISTAQRTTLAGDPVGS